VVDLQVSGGATDLAVGIGGDEHTAYENNLSVIKTIISDIKQIVKCRRSGFAYVN
jgi:hypothetical protein